MRRLSITLPRVGRDKLQGEGCQENASDYILERINSYRKQGKRSGDTVESHKIILHLPDGFPGCFLLICAREQYIVRSRSLLSLALFNKFCFCFSLKMQAWLSVTSPTQINLTSTDLCCSRSSFNLVLPLDSVLTFLLMIHLTLHFRLIEAIDDRVFPLWDINWRSHLMKALTRAESQQPTFLHL